MSLESDLLLRLQDAVEALDGTSVENEKLVDDYRKWRAMHDAAPSAEPVADEPVADDLPSREALADECSELRIILSKVTQALGTGAFASSACSLHFLSMIPEEVKKTVDGLRATRPAPDPAERGEYPPLPEPLSDLHRDRASIDAAANEYAISYFVDQVDKKYARDKARGMQMDSISYYLRDVLYWVRHHVDADRAQRVPLTDEQVELLIDNSDGRWHDGEFRIDAQDLTKLLRSAHGIGAKP